MAKDDDFKGEQRRSDRRRDVRRDGSRDRRLRESEEDFQIVDLQERVRSRTKRLEREELEEIEAVDENRRRLLCGFGALAISLPFLGLGIRKSILEAIQDKGEQTEEREENVPAKKPKNLGEAIKKNPRLIISLLNRPERLYRWFPEEKHEAVGELIEFINANKNKPWSRQGIEGLKKDIRKGNLELPKNEEEGKILVGKYFPDMPIGIGIRLKSIVEKLTENENE